MQPERRSDFPPKTGIKKKMIGEWLFELGLISPLQLADALTTQQETGGRIGEILIQKGFLTDRELSEILSLQEILASKSSLTDFPVDAETIALVTETFARKNLVIPLIRVGRRLIIATRSANDTKLLDHVSLVTGYIVVPIAFREEDLNAALDRFFEDRSRKVDDTIERAVKKSGFAEQVLQKQVIQDIASNPNSDAPIVDLVNSILNDAISRGVADIAIEPTEEFLVIRFRTDGIMAAIHQLPKTIEASVVTRIKVMAGMNITEKRRPQDGRFSVVSSGEKVDFRTSCIATHWGERISLRLLRTRAIVLGLDVLGFSEHDFNLIKQILLSPVGIILVTGPTGSGKTTTLYAMLQQFDKESESIITIEDPVEYPVSGIAQIQVNNKIDLTFSAALRTVLRQDPDTIMLGEIRDLETLETATHAAMTGHLVLSTLHTNGAVETISRMVEMGLAGYVVGSTINGVIAQRLVRKICAGCKADRPATAEEKAFLKVDPEEELILKHGTGCEKCNGGGMKGMLGVYEVLKMTRSIEALVAKGEPSIAIEDEARRCGMRTLLDDGKHKVMKGMTTVEEVIRVLGTGDDD